MFATTHEGVSTSFQTESVMKYSTTKTLIEKQDRLWWQNSLDWFTK